MLKKGEVKMIHKMLKDGLSKSAVARKLGIDRDTVAKYSIILKALEFPILMWEWVSI